MTVRRGYYAKISFELKRYSADLDFWFVKKVDINSYFEKIKQVLEQQYDLINEQIKFYTLLLEVRSDDYPKRLKIEIRKEVKNVIFRKELRFRNIVTGR